MSCRHRIRRPSMLVMQTSEEDVVRSSASTLHRYLTDILNRIFQSLERMPSAMRLVFRKLMQRVAEKWPEPEMKVLSSLDIHTTDYFRGITIYKHNCFIGPPVFGRQRISFPAFSRSCRNGSQVVLFTRFTPKQNDEPDADAACQDHSEHRQLARAAGEGALPRTNAAIHRAIRGEDAKLHQRTSERF